MNENRINEVLESTEKEAIEAGLIEKFERADCPAQITKRSTIQYGLDGFFFKEDPNAGASEVIFSKKENMDTMDLIKELISMDPTCDLTAQVIGSIRIENGTIFLGGETKEEEQPTEEVEYLKWENKKPDPVQPDHRFVRYIGDEIRRFIDMNIGEHRTSIRYDVNEEHFKVHLKFERVFDPRKKEDLIQVSYIIKHLNEEIITQIKWVTVFKASNLASINDPRIAEEVARKIYEPMAKKAMGK